MSFLIRRGYVGECATIKHLEERGYTIIEKNVRKRSFEIDVVARKGDVYAFIEVKTRKSKYVALPALISYAKQRRISRGILWFASRLSIFHASVLRCDVSLVTVDDQDSVLNIQYITNAFEAHCGT